MLVLRARFGQAGRIDKSDLPDDPIEAVGAWFGAAAAAGATLPEAMAVATVDPEGRPAVRMVLLRGLDGRGLVFYSDRESDKGRQLAGRPYAALLLHWQVPEHRQVRVSGPVELVSDEESDAYWASRPLGSRRSAGASRQSQPIGSRDELEARVAELEVLGEEGLSRPERWGGFRVVPEVVELWQSGLFRLHDRIRYRRRDDGGWSWERLSP